MIDFLVATLVAILIALGILLALWAVVLVASAVAGIELLNVALARMGFSRPSAEGHTPGQRHHAEVTSAFRFNAARGCGEGTVRLHGEIWQADCPAPLVDALEPGETVTAVYGDDLRVRVEAPDDAGGTTPR